MSNLTNALQELREERKKAQSHVEKLDQAISVIESLNGTAASGNGQHTTRVISAASRRKMALAQQARWAKAKNGSQPTASAPVKRTMSASARRKIAAAQKARWAKAKNGSQPIVAAKTTASAPVKRTMSASARRKIAAAQKARWAKVRAGKKSAA